MIRGVYNWTLGWPGVGARFGWIAWADVAVVAVLVALYEVM